MFCSNTNCKNNGILCDQFKCKCYSTDHPGCGMIQCQHIVNKILSKKMSLSEELSKSIDAIRKVYDDAI